MSQSKHFLAALLTLSFASIASADVAANACNTPRADGPSAIPAPAQVDQLAAIFSGKLTCKGAYTDIPGVQVAHPMEVECRVAKDLAGHWLHGRCGEKKTAQNPTPYSYEEFWTYDTAAGNFVRTFVGSLGDRSLYTSAGPTGNTISWTGQIFLAGATLTARDSSEQLDARHIRFSGDLSFDGGTNWIPQYTLDCVRR